MVWEAVGAHGVGMDLVLPFSKPVSMSRLDSPWCVTIPHYFSMLQNDLASGLSESAPSSRALSLNCWDLINELYFLLIRLGTILHYGLKISLYIPLHWILMSLQRWALCWANSLHGRKTPRFFACAGTRRPSAGKDHSNP